MNRRKFVWTISAVIASCGLAGCTVFENGENDADVSATVVRNAPENPGPYEDAVGPVTPQESDALSLDEFTFQRAGQKGVVVAGDAANTGDQPFGSVNIEVTLFDENESEDSIFDSASEQAEHGRLEAGETWQWAATFDDEPEFQIDYYSVEASANYP
ncbi:FxLYD domain-containing protein [Halomontanus rarus]|uniref:FxLYD domain-containing protein n=1 Tax=Halomontanus rarus TaxID=3034020 RepID=UPI0023E80D93|nr:FxLYD domain-containing protein [Halovivax sp. TS33]